MKSINKLAVAALLALSSASLASAATTIIHVVGSTAYRVADVTAECNYLHSLGSGTITATWFGASNGSLTGSNQSIVFGPVVSGNQTIFENHFSGSVGGAQELTDPDTDSGFPSHTTYAGTAATVILGTGGTPASGGQQVAVASLVAESAVAPDISFSDVFLDTAQQIFTPANTPNENIVGVVPFKFVAGKGSPAGLINMTPQLFNFLWSNGTVPLSLFTGSSTDETAVVYALGRDIDSGTRATAFSETGFGVITPPAQYYPYDTAANATANGSTGVIGNDPNAGTTINGINFVPPETLDGIFMDVGQGGYNSGGNLATAMKTTNGMSNKWIVTYLGLSDAASAIGTPGTQAVEMKYNGVSFSAAAVQEGQYTFWGYEHQFFNSNVSTVANALAAQIKSGDDASSSGGVTFTAMKVARSDDGQNVQPNFSF